MKEVAQALNERAGATDLLSLKVARVQPGPALLHRRRFAMGEPCRELLLRRIAAGARGVFLGTLIRLWKGPRRVFLCCAAGAARASWRRFQPREYTISDATARAGSTRIADRAYDADGYVP